MSSDPAGLTNLDYLETFRDTLARELPDEFKPFAEFFGQTRRLGTLGASLDAHLPPASQRVLNVGSGPFATEIFVAALQGQDVLALDYTPEFAGFFDLFRADGHLERVRFRQADITTEDFGDDRFDLIILHDILYEKALDLHTLVPRLAGFLSPSGYLYLDFVNTRTAWIWRMLGKPDRFARYDPAEVRARLEGLGLEIVDWRATHGATHPAVRALHGLLGLFGTSNNYAVLARRVPAADV